MSIRRLTFLSGLLSQTANASTLLRRMPSLLLPATEGFKTAGMSRSCGRDIEGRRLRRVLVGSDGASSGLYGLHQSSVGACPFRLAATCVYSLSNRIPSLEEGSAMQHISGLSVAFLFDWSLSTFQTWLQKLMLFSHKSTSVCFYGTARPLLLHTYWPIHGMMPLETNELNVPAIKLSPHYQTQPSLRTADSSEEAV